MLKYSYEFLNNQSLLSFTFSGWIWFVVLSHDIAVQYAGMGLIHVWVIVLYVWIIYRKEKLLCDDRNTPTGSIKKKLFNWFDFYFFSASRWITHDLWSSISSLFRVSRLDMDYCCMLKKTVLWSWSTFLLATKHLKYALY